MSALDRDLVNRARAAAKTIEPLAAQGEAERHLLQEGVRALVDAGVFKMFVPRALGGAAATPETAIHVLEELARADGSAGWCAMIGATAGLTSAYLDEAVAREIYGAPDSIACGVFAPMGRAKPEGDGFRVSGRWAFASGCEHAAWRMGGAIVEGDAPLASGAPNVRCMMFRAEDTTVVDTWHTSGLRGTGSHDIEVKDVLVPRARVFSMITDTPRAFAEGAIYALSPFGVLATCVASVALGIARAANDALIELATAKQPLGSKRTIAHRELVQLGVAKAEAMLRSARAGLVDAAADAARDPTLRARAHLRAAACHATTQAAAATDLAYEAGGASSIYTKNPLQRHFRDVHVATQHIMVSPTAATLAGRVLLGLEADTSVL